MTEHLVEAVGPADRWKVASPLLVGFGLAIVGAAAASSLQVWDLDGADRVERLAEASLTVWIWGNVVLGLGIVIAASGMFVLSSALGGVLARAGGALWLTAGCVGVVGFLFQGVGGAEAARVWNGTGQIPGGFLVVEGVQESLIVSFGGLGSLGILAIGIGSLGTHWLAKGLGAAVALVGVLGLVLLALNIPIIGLIGALVLGVGLLLPTRSSRAPAENTFMSP